MSSKGNTYLENFLEGLSGVPSEVTRNLVLMREIDAQVQHTLAEVSGAASATVALRESGDTAGADAQTARMREQLRDARALSDEKMALARQTYDLVDHHIRRLDTELRRFEAEIDGGSSAPYSLPSAAAAADDSYDVGDELYAPPEPQKKRTLAAASRTSLPSSSGSVASSRVRSFDLEMPVDPNEPTYCICGSVSFGQMIGCDNPSCKIEWFHFQCVGLTASPKGKWYCPSCKAAMKRHAV